MQEGRQYRGDLTGDLHTVPEQGPTDLDRLRAKRQAGHEFSKDDEAALRMAEDSERLDKDFRQAAATEESTQRNAKIDARIAREQDERLQMHELRKQLRATPQTESKPDSFPEHTRTVAQQ